MSSSMRAVVRARRAAETDRVRAGVELRRARAAAGLSLTAVSRASGISPSHISRIERGRLVCVSMEQVAVLAAVVGLDARLRLYPGGDPLRDMGHVRVLARLRDLLPAQVRLVTERPLPIAGDLRAWDGSISGLDGLGQYPDQLDVEVETRITDLQAQTRRIALKARDAGAPYVLLVVADTQANRDAVRAAGSSLLADFPVSSRRALAALREGRHPGGSALIFV
jgi:transcriptional regulator with XRE-family HTH domain